MKRVADVLSSETEKNIYRIDLPRLADERGCGRYSAILESFVLALETKLGTPFDEGLFLAACTTQKQEEPDSDDIALLGARVPPSLLAECESLCRLPVRDLTCAAQFRVFNDPPMGGSRADILQWYAGCLLDQTPCMRMADTTGRKALMTDPRLKGIIYHTIKFCDFYSFEYAAMERLVPVLKLETDFTPASTGQLRTRLEAFFEATGTQKELAPHRIQASESAGCYAGIDIGFTSTDAVLLDGDGRVLAQVVVPTSAKSMDAANRALEEARQQAGLEMIDIANMITTGYGRKSSGFESGDITEISCHARGVVHLFPQARAVIDIGGQDSKVIRLNTDGGVADFAMNDKCAAGTGRFLELMATTLNVSLLEMSALGERWDEEITISSMCAVFAESEVISLIAQNKETRDIVHGINLSIANRIAGLVARAHAEGPFVMSGGVAKNKGVLLALEQRLKSPILAAEDPQICGALGAALLAMPRA